MQWDSYRSAAVRYKALVELTDPTDKSVLDAGCGMGDLLPYILAKGMPEHYSGVDITPEFVNIASRHYLGFDFKVANPFDSDYSCTFNIVYCSGVLNMGGDDWLEIRKHMVSKLFALTTQTLAFNMAGSIDIKNIPKSTRVEYADAGEFLTYCKTLTPSSTLIADYHERDFTIVMNR